MKKTNTVYTFSTKHIRVGSAYLGVQQEKNFWQCIGLAHNYMRVLIARGVPPVTAGLKAHNYMLFLRTYEDKLHSHCE